MTVKPQIIDPRRRTPARPRRGFSFTEVLFAVMILGVGFIMIAAIFPVAIQQSKATNEETAAAANARSGAAILQQIATNQTMPATANQVFKIGQLDPVLRDMLVRGNLITPSDPRHAWVVLYRRAGAVVLPPFVAPPPADWGSYAQVFLIPVQVRNESTFQAGSLYSTNPNRPFHVEPVAIRVNISPGRLDVLAAENRMPYSTNNPTNAAAAVVEGCHLIVAFDNLPVVDPMVPQRAGWMNGRIYRVGAKRDDLAATAWDLMPDGDFSSDPGPDGRFRPPDHVDNVNALTDATAFIVGRGVGDPAQPPGPANQYTGPAQDVAVYTTFVRIN